jgi:multidrug efflux pump subunit AcrA (membrane-fusion protein)
LNDAISDAPKPVKELRRATDTRGLRPMRIAFAAVALLIAAALGFAASQWRHTVRAAAPPTKSSPIVIVVRSTDGCFSDMIRVTGFLVPRKVAVVSVDEEGLKITDVLVSEGDHVNSGQDLVRLSRQASQNPRAPGGTIPARSTTLRAPAAGLILSNSAMVGAVASPRSGPLFSINTDNEIELEVEVPSQQVPKLSPGATARITIDNGREVTGRVRHIDGEINYKTQLGQARLSIDQDPASLRVGIFARATIDASRSCGISVPRSSIIYRTEGTSVQVVRDNVIETRKVQVGLLSDNNVEIRDGLSAGDMLVANSGTSFHDGDQVRPIFIIDVDQAGVR